eukprot:CAMPEP_0119113868 /NCGR_PEP_ID=MMETSP1180-20130426/45440_1 /TAXON_ID=3052 ORGANISM="Chlamydomonas cf sp, Strain CCMP681" /NCGR_SAMPLE_ID=MMETSP1180 /ASSEMBLY_ACC=CAM_ASM_000741 /LENGTH=35 /DNA_ID= /DNA_START= /DNA_END= /DNA_ORIENTATION=
MALLSHLPATPGFQLVLEKKELLMKVVDGGVLACP